MPQRGQGGAPASGPAFSRRAALRAALGGATAVAAGSVLAGCGPTIARLRTAAAQTVTLVWLPWYGFPRDPNVSAATAAGAMQEGIQGWLERQPGVEVEVRTPGDTAATMAAMLAGTGPDVFHDANLPLYVQQGLVLDLTPYVERDRVDLTLYAQGQMDYIRASAGAGGLYALPATLNTLAMGVDHGRLDELGLSYPEAGWTYQQWAQLWSAATSRTLGSQRYGGRFDWSGYDDSQGNPAAFYLRGFGGEYVDPGDNAQCALSAPGSVEALRWCYDLVLSRVCAGSEAASVVDQVQAGQLVTGPVGNAADLYAAARQWSDRPWDLHPMPVWPTGALTLGSSDFYAVWAGSSAPDLAWSLLRYLTVGPEWQTKMMRLMAGPNQKALWDNWKALVVQLWVPLQDKNLDAFVDAVRGDQAYVGRPFRFAESSVTGILTAFGRRVLAGQVTVVAAATQAAQQINALQKTGAAKEQAALTALKHLRQGMPAASAVTPAGGVTPAGAGSP